MDNTQMNFEEWYAALLQELTQRGISQHVDRGIARGDYDLGMSTLQSAEIFINQFSDESEAN